MNSIAGDWPAGALRSEGATERDDTIARTLNVVWRGKWLVLAAAFIAVGLAYVAVKQMTPIYASRALVMIEGREQRVIDVEAVVSGLEASQTSLLGEIEIITSDQLARRVVEKLRLDRDPEFNAALRQRSVGPIESVVALLAPETAAAWFGAPSVVEPLGPELDAAAADIVAKAAAEREHRAVVERVREAVRAQPRGRSFVIDVQAQSTSPSKAALIANTVADQYIVDQLEAKFDGTRRATLWLEERLGELKGTVEAAERAVEEYRSSQVDDGGAGVDVTSQQLAQLNASLIDARAKTAEAEARYRAVAERDASSSSAVLSAGSVAALRAQLSELRRREAELASRYGPKHPRMINLRAEIADAQAAIGGEVGKVVETLRNDLEVAQAREASLEQSVAALQGRSFDQSKASIRLRELEREAEANRAIYESFLTRFKETSAQEELNSADARVIARAQPSDEPASPKVLRIVGIAGVVGLMAGVAGVFLLEQLNNTFRRKEDLEAASSLTVLAMVPKLGARRQRAEVFGHLRSAPNSALAESARNLRTSLLLANVDAPPKVVLVTSAIPAEGKSTLALLLAATSASMGKRTLIVDCDLRRPTLKDVFPVQPEGDLVAVIAGEATLAEALVADDDEYLFALPGRVSKANPADIFTSQRFRALVKAAREQFDMVVLDSPPVLPVSDARILSEIADTTIVATRWDDTPREIVLEAISQLRSVNARIAGCAMTMVDTDRQDAYYGRYGRYRSDYTSYYRG